MANPNIAALSELHVGTLAWNLKTSQVIFVKGVKERETYSTTATAELYCPSNVAGITLSNKIVFVCTASNQSTVLTGLTHSDDALTLMTATSDGTNNQTRVAMYSANYDWMSMGYKLNPQTNEDNSNIVATVNSGSSAASRVGMYAANVDQTTPFRVMKFPQHLHDSTQQFVHGHVGEGDYQNTGAPNPSTFIPPQPGELGDLSLVMAQTQSGNGYSYMMNTAAQWSFGSQHSSTSDASGLHGKWSGIPPGGFVPTDMIYEYRFMLGGQYPSDETLFAQAIMQSNRTKDTLLTCPAERVLKINSIRAANPEVPQIYINVDLEGLGAVNDTAGSAAAEPTGNDATVTIAKSVRVPENGVELLQRPFYMVEGDIIKANAKMNKHFPQWNEMGVDIIISFESMED